MGCPALKTKAFFSHVEPFMNYRKTVYEVSDETVRSNRTDLSLFERFLKRRKTNEITGPAVMDFQVWLKTERENSGASVNRKIFTLRSYGKYMRLAEPESANDLPFQDVLKIRQGYREKPQALTRDQLKVFFESVDRNTCLGIRDYAVYSLMYGLGLRVGEIHKLNLDSLDTEKNILHVIGKGGRRRQLHLTGEMPRIIAEYAAVRRHFMNSKTSDAFFLSKKGNRLSIRTMEDNFRKLYERSGIMVWFHVTCHTLRHCFASHLNDEDVDILVLQSLLGHSTPKSTQIYIHPSMQRMKEALEKLPAVVYMNELVAEMRFQSKARYRPELFEMAIH
jgi:site-specific recombinase XerD